MIRLMLATYSKEEREQLSVILENAQGTIESLRKCRKNLTQCRTCPMRHLCTDLLSASVFAKDFVSAPEKLSKA